MSVFCELYDTSKKHGMIFLITYGMTADVCSANAAVASYFFQISCVYIYAHLFGGLLQRAVFFTLLIRHEVTKGKSSKHKKETKWWPFARESISLENGRLSIMCFSPKKGGGVLEIRAIKPPESFSSLNRS